MAASIKLVSATQKCLTANMFTFLLILSIHTNKCNTQLVLFDCILPIVPGHSLTTGHSPSLSASKNNFCNLPSDAVHRFGSLTSLSLNI